MKSLLIWITNTKIYSDLLLKVIPYVRFSLYYTSIRGNVYTEAYKVIKKGDILLSKDSKKLTAILIGGTWTHAALFMGKSEEGVRYEVAEMTHHNFTKSDLFDFVKESTEFTILRCPQFDEEYINEILNKCKTFENAKYDVGFELGVTALYCSELVYQADFERRLNADLKDIHGLGRQYISPEGLALSSNIEVIFDSRKIENRY